jgi:hypothetical protein
MPNRDKPCQTVLALAKHTSIHNPDSQKGGIPNPLTRIQKCCEGVNPSNLEINLLTTTELSHIYYRYVKVKFTNLFFTDTIDSADIIFLVDRLIFVIRYFPVNVQHTEKSYVSCRALFSGI